MKKAKLSLLVALMLVPLALPLHAQVLKANIIGASSFWTQAGQGIGPVGTPGNCAWTKSANNAVTDSRIAAPNTESDSMWVVWTPGTGGTCAAPTADSEVYAYMKADSTVGNRCLFARPACTLGTTNAALTAGDNLLTGVIDTPLPAGVLAAFNNKPVTVAGSDVLPADAKFATYSALASCAALSPTTQFWGYGYGPGNVGTSIQSYYSTKKFNVVNFNIYGNDPITAQPIPTSVYVDSVGAAPELVIVNTLNQNAGAFGDPAVKNINRGPLSLYLIGILARTADILPQAFAGTSATYYPATVLLREPLSGTYRVMEHSVAGNKQTWRTQETNNCGTPSGGYTPFLNNPLHNARTVGGTTSYRNRVIGTGEMVTKLTQTQDALGYAFWGTGTFAGKSGIKYLTVDGIDPLFDSYNDGTIPQASNGLLPSVSFSHVKDGTYPIWTMYRMISLTSAGHTAAQQVIAAANAMLGPTQPDFVPVSQMNVFHGHYAPTNVNFNANNAASDGICGLPEAGSDAGGVVFTMQAGVDYCVLKGSITNGPGPVNDGTSGSAAFGVRF